MSHSILDMCCSDSTTPRVTVQPALEALASPDDASVAEASPRDKGGSEVQQNDFELVVLDKSQAEKPIEEEGPLTKLPAVNSVLPAPAQPTSMTTACRSPREQSSPTVKKMLKRGLSNFSVGSKNSGKSAGSSHVSSKGEHRSSFFSKWQAIFAGSERDDQEPTPISGNDERMVSFQKNCVTVSPEGLNLVQGGQPNLLRTSRFTWVTWIPKSFYAQFQRIANIYFLFISAIVLFPWSPKNPISKIVPFIGVLIWSALKDLYEDMRRKRDDRAVNAQVCKRISSGGGHLEECTWADVLVGDVLFVPQDMPFPADLVLVHASGGSEAFISTVMLDGETSLKDRVAPSLCEVLADTCAQADPQGWEQAQLKPQLDENLEKQLLQLVKHLGPAGLDLRCAAPTVVLNDVRGVVQPRAAAADAGSPISEPNFLPRGCVLRNTAWVLAVVLYVGADSKTRMNTAQMQAGHKFSNMQINLNFVVRILLCLVFVLCSYATVISFAARGTLAAEPSVEQPEDNNPIFKFLKFCISFYHVVPMSLYVVYEMLKLVLGWQLNTDKSMVDPESGEPALARTADLMEELGQVDFLFSDKTGTLTRNEMVFAHCHVAGEDLGDFRSKEGEVAPGVQRAHDVLNAELSVRSKEFEPMLNFFTCLALCHNVQVAKTESGLSYSGASPDEVALVEAAHLAGVSFESRVRKSAGLTVDMTLAGPETAHRKFTLLHELPFSSDRKRMSVLVRHRGAIWCVTKGADSVMEGLLREPVSQSCQDDLARFSKQGLRTLMIAMKKVSSEDFESWSHDYSAARNLVDTSKEQHLADLAARMEQDLKLVGLTAVEDRLQDGVPETIETMKQMGIRVWLLTGDKTETAVDIARSCRLFQEQTKLAYAVGAQTEKQAEDLLLKAYGDLDGHAEAGLVLDGSTIRYALQNKECRKLIYDLGISSRSCVCARLSPMQKLELVQLVREHAPKSITCSIGDGANDVPMIYGAHVGVAVRGREGTQSVQASDVALGQFRFLLPLLQCHGRRAYRRVALFLTWYIYKNIAEIMFEVIWMHQDMFRARIGIPEFLSIQYNVNLTSWHILFVLGYDLDISNAVALVNPELYKVGPRRELFNIRLFTKWLVFAVIQGSASWLLPQLLIHGRFLNGEDYEKGVVNDFWVVSVAAFGVIVFVVCLKLVMVAQNWCGRHTVVPTAITMAFYFMAVFGLAYVPPGPKLQPCMVGLPTKLMEPKVMIAFAATVFLALVPDMVEQAMGFFLYPTPLQKVQKKQLTGK